MLNNTRHRRRYPAGPRIAALLVPALLLASPALAQCPEEPPLQNYTGGGTVVCPCFASGEQAGVILNAPPEHFPMEILRIGIGWGSLYNANPAQIEQAIHIYPDSLPNPGSAIFTLSGPQLNDGVINEFNIEPLPGEVTVDSGPFTVSLEFLNDSYNNSFASSVVHDGNGCQSGKNVVYAIPGGWYDACALGVTGDWVMYVVYRPCVTTGIDGTFIASSAPAIITRSHPNPFTSNTNVDFLLQNSGRALVAVYDVLGRRVATLADESFDAGTHVVTWDGTGTQGEALPSGMYFVKLDAAGTSSVRKVLLAK
jgi:hypothetical protein